MKRAATVFEKSAFRFLDRNKTMASVTSLTNHFDGLLEVDAIWLITVWNLNHNKEGNYEKITTKVYQS